MSDFLKRRIQERDEQRRGTQETSAPASSFLQQRIQQRDTQRAESGYRAPTGTHKTMHRHVARGVQGQARRALAAWKSTSATTESGLANPKEAQARKTYQTMRKQYNALQQRESEKQQAQAAQQEYDELRVADLNALKAKMDAAKESADGSAKERVVAGSIVKQKDSGAQAAYEEAARKYNLAQQIQYDERGALALGKLSEEEAAAVDTLAKSTNKGRKTDIVGAGVIDEMRRKATKVLTDAGYSAEEIDELANWRARQQNAQKYDAAVEKREALADKGFWGAAAATALSVPETLAERASAVIDVAVQNYRKPRDRPPGGLQAHGDAAIRQGDGGAEHDLEQARTEHRRRDLRAERRGGCLQHRDEHARFDGGAGLAALGGAAAGGDVTARPRGGDERDGRREGSGRFRRAGSAHGPCGGRGGIAV